MTPENRRPQAPLSKEIHPGIIPVEEGGERPHLEDAPSVQDINTGEIPTLLPDHSGKLILTDEERSSKEFQEKTDYYKQRTAENETGWLPTDNEALTNSTDQTRHGKGKMFAILGGTAAAAVTAASLFLLPKGESTDNNNPTPTQPVATGEVTPGQTQETPGNKVDVTKRPQSIVEQGLFNELSLEQQAEIRQLDAMPTEEFYKLPMATQLKYAQFIYDSNVERTKYLIKQNGSEYAPLLKTVDPKPDNSGTEVWYQQQLRTEVQYTLMPDQKPLDKVNAQKLIVLGTTQDTAGFMSAFNTLETDKGGLLTPDNNPILAYKTDVQGTEATMKINANVENTLTQTTYKYTTFTDISGKERGTWQATLSVNSSDPRFVSSIK